jgi:hypothetical protein
MFLILVLALVPAALGAQSSPFETVYFAQPNNKILKVVEFQLPHGPGEAETVVVQDGSNFQGLVVRQDNLIFVASRTKKGSILVCDPEAGECRQVVPFKGPEGLDISTMTGALIAASGDDDLLELDPTGCSQTFDSPNCRPGGYNWNFVRKELKCTDAIADVKFARISKGPFTQGDIAVLSQKPARLFKMTDINATPTPVLSEIKFNGKSQTPTGLAFNAAGDALIATKQGLLLRYPGGNGSPELFASLGGPGAKVTVGVQGPDLQERIFATVQSGKVLCFESDGASCGKVAGVVAPDGIGIATGAFQTTQTGANVSQILNLGLRTEWEEIVQEGASVALCRQFVDTRNGLDEAIYLCDPDKNEGFECRTGSSPFFVDFGLPNVIPGHVRAYKTGTSAATASGPETFQVCVMNTSAGFRGIIRDHVGIPLDLSDHTTTWIGYDFHELCPEPGVFYSPGIGDDEPVEGFEFTDVTLACNHPLGGSWSRSTYLMGARTTMTPCEEAEFKLDNLDATLDVEGPGILGACDVGTPTPGGIPEGSSEQLMDDAFAFAQLGSRTDWSLVSAGKGAFGSAGNGFVLGGGTIEVLKREAGFKHEFGTASSSHGGLTPIVTDSSAQVGASLPFAPGDDSYLFYFKNIQGEPLDTPIFSDGFSDSSLLGIAVYQNNADPTRFALFYDDGTQNPDKDFDDLIVTATGAVGTSCQLRIGLDDAIEQFEGTACPGSFATTIETLENDFIAVIDGAPDDFPASGNVDAQLKARALSLIFVLTDKIGTPPDP